MKRIITSVLSLLMTAAIMPALASAPVSLSPTMGLDSGSASTFAPTDATLTLSRLPGTQRYSGEADQWWQRAIPTTSAFVTGNYIHDSYNNAMLPTSVTGMYAMNIAAGTSAGQVILTNLCGGGASLQGTVNEADGTLTIPGGQVVGTFEGLEGKLYLADFTLNRYYMDAMVARVSPRGIIIMPQMIVILSDGRQMRCQADMLYKMNATQTDYSLWQEGADAVKTYPVHFSRTNSAQILIKNFYGYGFPLSMTIDTVGNLTIPYAQVAVGTSSTGSAIVLRNYAVTAINYDTDPATPTCTTAAGKGIFKADSLVTGSYCVAGSTTANRADLILKSVIKVQASDAFEPMNTSLSLPGSGTAADPWKVSSAADLQAIARAANYNPAMRTTKQTFLGRHFVQTADIDLSDVENFEPICWDDGKGFAGVYDGQGHTISNMTINGTRGASYHSAFIGELDDAGTVRNLKFVKPKVTSTSSYVATVAAHAYGKIENIEVIDADISMPANSSSYCGGIAGLMVNNSHVTDCSISGNVAGQSFVGSIAGNCNGSKIRRCQANVNLQTIVGNATHPYIGGILGYFTRDTAVVEDCVYVGAITMYDDEYGGGIIGGGQKGTISRCWSNAQMLHRTSSDTDACIGGIQGRAEGTTITDCLFSGIAQSYATPSIGGLVGTTTAAGCQLNSSLNLGTIMCAGNVRDNELVAENLGITITNSYYDKQAGNHYGTLNGLTTADLTSGSLPQGLQADVWSAEAGFYPMLKQYLSHPRANLDRTPFFLANGENVNGIRSNFTVGSQEGVKWYFFHNMQYSTQGNGLKIEGNNVTVTATSLCSDTIVAIKDGYFRMIPVKVTPKEFEGEGTAASPYLIRNMAQFNSIFKAVDEDLFDYTGTFFRLDTDLDYAGVTDFRPYSRMSPAYAFNGTLDGNGHHIKNLVLAKPSSASTVGAFFMFTGPQSEIKNIIIDSSCHFMGGSNVGFVAGHYGTLRNIINEAPVTALYNSAAGIATIVYENARIIDCLNTGTITGGRRWVGGIASQTESGSLIQGCQNAGHISAVNTSFNDDETDLLYIGGIAGDPEGTLLDCLNQGMVSGYGYVGGIAGSWTGGVNVRMRRCLNTGIIVEGEKNTTRGALIGAAWSVGDDRLSGCYYDIQLSYSAAADGTDLDGIEGVTTERLVSGQPLDSLSTDMWQYAAGKYPVLKAFASHEASQWYAGARVDFAASPRRESRFDIRSDATIVLPQGSTASLAVDSIFSISGNKLVHTPTTSPQTDTITLRSANGLYSISASLFATPKLLANGSGTEADPWMINNADDWNTLAQYSNFYHKDFDMEYFRLGADIDFTAGFEPICLGSEINFNGIIDGNGKRILKAKYEDPDQKYIGLVGSAGTRALIYNLTLDSTCYFSGNQYVGAVAGHLEGEVHHVTNYATVKTTTMQYAAGVAGEAYGDAYVHHCVNYGPITSTNNSGAGGIVANAGEESVRVTDCVNYGPISAKGTCGGVVSTNKGNVFRCRNHGPITSTSTNAGGVIGYIWGTGEQRIEDCVNYANVSSTGNNAGGLSGYMQGTAHIANCINYGEVKSGASYAGGILAYASTASSQWTMKKVENHGNVTANAYVGGIIGYSNTSKADNPSTLDSAANYGNVKAITTTYAGGIAGNVSNYVRLQNVCNYGDTVFTKTYSCGGIAGRCTGSIINAYNHADVISTTYNAGGICGESNTSTTTDYGCTIANAINVGHVKSLGTTDGNGFKVGGILGTGFTKVENCVNMGDVSGRKAVAGIVGLPVKGKSATVYGTQVINCYNTARVNCSYEANGKYCGAIMGDNATAVLYTLIENCYYDTQMAGSSLMSTYADANKEAVKGLNTAALFNAPLGTGFTITGNGYPMPAIHAGKDYATLASAAIVLADSDHADKVASSFRVVAPEGVQWTGPDMYISGNGNMHWNSADLINHTPLVASIGNHSRRVLLKLETNTGISTPDAQGADVKEVIYYNLNGLQVAHPSNGVYVKVTIFTNGTRRQERVMIKN